jgi:inner membrane protein
MDTLTHALSGALIARATEPRGGEPLAARGWRRAMVGFLAAAFPDVDFFLSYVSPVAYLLGHRGVTHSVLLLPLWALLLSWLFARSDGARPPWRAYYGVCALALGMHIAGDLITSFGTMIFAPFSDTRWALGTTFIIDPWFTGLVAIALLASAAWSRTRAPAVAGLALLAAYVGMQALLQQQAVEWGEAYARARGLGEARVNALPRPVSPFNWMVIVDEGDRYHHASVNLRRRAPLPPPGPGAGLIARLDAAYRPLTDAVWEVTPRFGGEPAEQRLGREAWRQPGLAFFRWFAAYPALLRVEQGSPSTCVWFYDLRFYTPGRESLPFRFGVCRDGPDHPWRPFQLTEAGPRALAEPAWPFRGPR